MPRGYDPEHPDADLLRRRNLRLGGVCPVPRAIHDRRFVAWCARRFEAVADVHRWLVTHLGDRDA